jgi:hypothetical protein
VAAEKLGICGEFEETIPRRLKRMDFVGPIRHD